jgi:hypothetical protein
VPGERESEGDARDVALARGEREVVLDAAPEKERAGERELLRLAAADTEADEHAEEHAVGRYTVALPKDVALGERLPEGEPEGVEK